MAVLSEEEFDGSKIARERNKTFESRGIMCITVAETEAGKFGLKSLHYYTQIEAAAGLLLIPTVRLGFNPGELIDFVVGCRFPLADPKAMSLRNLLGNQILSLGFWLLYGRRLKDSQSGMWVFLRRILHRIQPTCPSWSFSEEIKIEVLACPELRLAEEHISYRVRSGRPKLPAWSAGWEGLTFLFRKRLALARQGRWRRTRRLDP